MTSAVLLASSALAVVLVLALVREVRLRRALQALLRRLLEKWRSIRHEQDFSCVDHPRVVLPALSGCDEDERAQMHRSQAQVAEASRQLVQADAKARTETIAMTNWGGSAINSKTIAGSMPISGTAIRSSPTRFSTWA